MNDPKYKAINFDLDTKALKMYYPDKSWRKAYSDIKQFLIANGFKHRQWSGYKSISKLSESDVLMVVDKLKVTFPWVSQCVRRFDVTDIGKSYDMIPTLLDNAKIKSKDKSPSPNTQSKSKQKPHSSLSQLKANAKAQIEKREQDKGQSISQNKVKNYNER